MKAKLRDAVFWSNEATFIRLRAQADTPGPEFNDDWATFAKYVSMQARACERDGHPTITRRINAVYSQLPEAA